MRPSYFWGRHRISSLLFRNSRPTVSESCSRWPGGKPGGLIYASAGSGSGAHLAMELIKSMAGVSIVHAPYKTTTAAIPDVIAGNVHIMVTVAGNARGLVEAGRLKAIAATSAKRSTVFPDVPTVAESGLPGYESTVWYCVLAPAGTPSSIVNRLNADILKAIQAPDLRQRLETGASMELTGSTPEELGRYIRSELRKWAKVVKDSGAKID